ncbi:hypothetical protein [uncultured Shewanella sp.]|uniref:hypothetical protein n=1 Tax=uncultured Shewanella sp. TaxID=173975 RepID=UPI002633C3A2|nr:hypothetical protein [uncultured Shewanella sp.]
MKEQDIRIAFQHADLPVPPLPRELIKTLSPISDLNFCSQQPIASPYDLPQYLPEILQSNDDFFSLGQTGYGINNLYFYYYLQWNNLTLAIQQHWGGAYINHTKNKQKLETYFSLLRALLFQVHKKHNNFNGKLIIVDSVIHSSGWGWQYSDNTVKWHDKDQSILKQVQTVLSDIA